MRTSYSHEIFQVVPATSRPAIEVSAVIQMFEGPVFRIWYSGAKDYICLYSEALLTMFKKIYK